MARRLRRRFERRLPTPQAVILGVGLTAVLFWNLGNGVLVRGALTVLDTSYRQLDALFEEASPRPDDPLKTGGPGSLLSWEGLGRAGREMVAAAPDAALIAARTGAEAEAAEPLRVHVGLNPDLSDDLHQVIGDHVDGALWAGPPFTSRTWRSVTRAREPGTPAWLPRVRDGSVIRFVGPGGAGRTGADWAGYRIVYLSMPATR